MSGWWSSVLLFSSRSVVFNCATPWTAAGQASRSFTISRSLLTLMSVKSHPVLCLGFNESSFLCSSIPGHRPLSGVLPVSPFGSLNPSHSARPLHPWREWSCRLVGRCTQAVQSRGRHWLRSLPAGVFVDFTSPLLPWLAALLSQGGGWLWRDRRKVRSTRLRPSEIALVPRRHTALRFPSSSSHLFLSLVTTALLSPALRWLPTAASGTRFLCLPSGCSWRVGVSAGWGLWLQVWVRATPSTTPGLTGTPSAHTRRDPPLHHLSF